MEFVSYIETRKGKKLLKVFKSKRAVDMFLKKNTDKILSKSGIESVGSMSKRDWDSKEAKYAVNEGKKRYYQQDGIGKAKYTISYHDGKKKHKDGSDFFDIQTFRNKKDLAKFVNTLHKGGYKYGFDESVNERINPKFYDARVQYIDPKSKKKFVGDVVRYDNGEYKVNLGKDGRFEKYILAKEKDLKIVSKSKKKTFESVKESSKYRHLYYTNESKTKESKVIQKIHTYTKTEKKFYDELAKHEVRIGQKDYAKFIINALRGFGINPREFKRIPDAEEKLYQTVSKKWLNSKNYLQKS